jgi:hypothetical protein
VPDLTNDQLTLGLAIAGGVALLSFLFALVALMRLRKARKEYMLIRGDAGERDILSAVGRAMRNMDALNRRQDALTASQEEQRALGRYALQRFALIRYDAFEDMGGRLSFSAAILDDHGDGVVITSINGRTETRTYAKPVSNLTSEHNLSDEERRAVAAAAEGADRGESRAAVSS